MTTLTPTDPAASPSSSPAAAPAAIPGPLSVAQLLDRSFRLYRARFGEFITLAAIFLLPQALLSGLASGRMVSSWAGMLQGTLTTPNGALPGSSAAATLLAAGAALAGTVLLLACTLVLTRYSIDALHGRTPGRRETLLGGVRHFWSQLGMSLLRLLGFVLVSAAIAIVVGLLIGLVAAAAAFFSGMGESESGAGDALYAVILICLACFSIPLGLLVISPLIYLYMRWFVATPAIVNEDAGPAEALRTSWRLTKGSLLRLTGFGLLLYILSVITVTLPMGLLQWVSLIFIGSTASMVTLVVATSLAGAALGILWQPLYAIAVVLFYFDLRVRRESYDLTLRMDALTSELAAAPGTPSDG